MKFELSWMRSSAVRLHLSHGRLWVGLSGCAATVTLGAVARQSKTTSSSRALWGCIVDLLSCAGLSAGENDFCMEPFDLFEPTSQLQLPALSFDYAPSDIVFPAP
jgi:hypothetical protein